MFLESVVENAQLYFLIFARIFALISIAPLLSSQSLPETARAAIALFTSVAVFPWIAEAGYPIPDSGLAYTGLLIGEIMIGLITGFLLQLVYSAFITAGQFFSLQMGFGASVVFDPLAQVEIPIMGQLFNNFAMFVFIAAGGFYKVFLVGVYRSFQSLNAYTLLIEQEFMMRLMITSIGKLFEQAMIISLPILGSLFLVSLSMGLLAKAAPQMNLLMMGFPVSILVAYTVILLSLPLLMKTFADILDSSFIQILRWYSAYGAGS